MRATSFSSAGAHFVEGFSKVFSSRTPLSLGNGLLASLSAGWPSVAAPSRRLSISNVKRHLCSSCHSPGPTQSDARLQCGGGIQDEIEAWRAAGRPDSGAMDRWPSHRGRHLKRRARLRAAQAPHRTAGHHHSRATHRRRCQPAHAGAAGAGGMNVSLLLNPENPS